MRPNEAQIGMLLMIAQNPGISVKQLASKLEHPLRYTFLDVRELETECMLEMLRPTGFVNLMHKQCSITQYGERMLSAYMHVQEIWETAEAYKPKVKIEQCPLEE